MPPPGSFRSNLKDSTGPGPQKSAPDDHVAEIEEILKDLVEDKFYLAGHECKIMRYVPGEGQFQWIVYLVTPRKQALAEWNGLLSAAKDELSWKEAEVAGHMGQFKGLSAIAANIHLLKKSGPVKEYREGKKQLEELAKAMADLESRVQELGTYGYWVHEFPGRGKYAVYPYPSALEVRTSSSGGRLSSLAILLSPQLEPKGKEVLHDVGVRLGGWVQNVYDGVDVHLDFSKSAMLYTIPLADARAKEAAARKEPEKKPAEKKPKGRTMWP